MKIDHQIFISYAKKDGDIAGSLASKLEGKWGRVGEIGVGSCSVHHQFYEAVGAEAHNRCDPTMWMVA